jgi:hypothetical protein
MPRNAASKAAVQNAIPERDGFPCRHGNLRRPCTQTRAKHTEAPDFGLRRKLPDDSRNRGPVAVEVFTIPGPYVTVRFGYDIIMKTPA